MNDIESGKAVIKHALELDSKSATAYAALADNELKAQNYEEAVKNYELALQTIKDSDELYIKAGNAYKLKGDEENAMTAYKNALAINPINQDAYFNIGIIQYDRGEVEAALENFVNSAKYKNDFALSYYGQGLCLEKLNKKSDAIFAYEKFIELAPENPLTAEVKQKIDILYEEIMK